MDIKDKMHHETVAKHLRVLLLGSLIFVSGFGVYHVWVGAYPAAIVEAFLFVFLVTSYTFLVKNLYVNYVMHGVMFMGLMGTLANMSTLPTTAVWIGGMVIGAFALLGKKQGIYWVVIVNLSLMIFMLVDANSIEPLYSKSMAVNLVLSCFWISLVAFYAYRNSNDQHARLLQETSEKERQAVAKTLTTGMAHVINNEMLVVVGTAECVQFRMKDKQDIADLEKIITLGLKASEHVNKLASYAKFDVEEPQDISLSEFFIPVLKDWQKSLPDNIKVQLKEPDFTPHCYGDEVQIAQALLNILENSKEAIIERWQRRTPVSAGHITISFVQQHIKRDNTQIPLPAGEYTCILIADDGCGISESAMKDMFEPFVTSKLAGRGLGLVAVDNMIKSHQGYIAVESDVGKGSLFHVWLPSHKQNKADKQPNT